MKKTWFLQMIIILLLAACGSDSGSVTPAISESTTAAVVADEAPTETLPAPTAVPTEVPTETPVPEPTATSAPARLTEAAEMVGIWLGTVAGERGYVMYTADGRFFVALIKDNLPTMPLVFGEYWFENDQIHLRDLENAGHWIECSADVVGVYDVLDLGDGAVQFQTVEDDCNEGGFTRNFLFANMKQEWQSAPVAAGDDPLP